MTLINWQSPWPQWRTHWHVWHAWPALAQALVLSTCCICTSTAGSWFWSNQAWQAWMSAEDTEAQMQEQLAQLHTQQRQLQSIQASLQAQPHPSGASWPAWQSLPHMDVSAQQTSMQQLAQQHGLQLQAVSEEGGQWRGPLPHLLAAWQNMAHQLPQYRLLSFELKRLELPALHDQPPHPRLAPVLVQMQWQWTTDLENETPLRPVASAQTAALKTLVGGSTGIAGAQVLHNPFTPDGVAKALPPSAHKAVEAPGLQGQSLDEMQWVGMLFQAGQRKALVKQGRLVHTVDVGQAMGQDWGEVVQIAADHLVLREWRVNELGQWQAQNTRFPPGAKP